MIYQLYCSSRQHCRQFLARLACVEPAARHCDHQALTPVLLSCVCLYCIMQLQLGPLRNVEGAAEIAGCASAVGVVLILALCLSVYGSASFQSSPKMGVKTLSGRSVQRDPLQSADG
jgi:hypothetical protein